MDDKNNLTNAEVTHLVIIYSYFMFRLHFCSLQPYGSIVNSFNSISSLCLTKKKIILNRTSGGKSNIYNTKLIPILTNKSIKSKVTCEINL